MEDAQNRPVGKKEYPVIAPKSRRQRTMRKLQKLRFRRSLNQNRSWGSSGHDATTLYDMKLAKLRGNNRALAKALASQKIETQHWYNKVISLKAELQDAQELLRSGSTDNDAAIEKEVEQRLREYSEPFNAAISESMQNVLVVVESLTKLKGLAGGALKNRRSRSSSTSRKSSSAFSLPRASGSRLPLAPTGSNSSPRQSVVRPMVGGLVLQPARVAIPKLDLTWRRRLQERLEARQDLDLSIIGEQSVHQEEEEISSQNDVQAQNDFDLDMSNRTEETESSELGNRSCDDSIVSQNSSVDEIQPAGEPEHSQRRRRSAVNNTPESPRGTSRRGGRGRGRPRRGDSSNTPNNSPATSKAESSVTSGTEVQGDDVPVHPPEATPDNLNQQEEDPLEGPSWWYTDLGALHGSRGGGRGRSRGRGRQRSSAKHSPGINLALESSSESECDELPSRKSKVSEKGPAGLQSPQVDKEPTCASLEVNKSPPLSLDHSYLASPASMLARLENLEAKSGRRSKARSRGMSLRGSTENAGRSSEVGTEGQRRLTRRRTEIKRNSLEADPVKNEDDSFNLKLEETVLDDGDDYKVESQLSDSILMPPPSLPLPVVEKDFLITDNDLTCIGDISMDMTEPLSKIIGQAAVDLHKGEDTKIERRFFKTQSPDLVGSPKVGEAPEKTPFDLSLMDATVVNIPPYSSQRSLEKENLPPHFDGENSKEEKKESVNLRRVSVVLEDVMKCPDLPDKYTPDLKLNLSAQKVKSAGNSSGKSKDTLPKASKAESPLLKKPKKRKTLRFSVAHEEEEEDEDEHFSPKKGRRSQKGRRKNSSVGMTRGRRSTLSRRTSNVDNVPAAPARKQRRRKKEPEDDSTPQTTPDISMISDLEEESSAVPCKTSSEEEGMTKITLPVQNDISNNKNMNLNDCYVMVHRTPEKIVQQSAVRSEDTLVLELDCTADLNSPTLMSPAKSPTLTSPVKLGKMDNLSKQMELVMKKAQQMKMDQEGIQDTAVLEEIMDPCEAPEETTSEASGEAKSDEQGSPVTSKSEAAAVSHSDVKKDEDEDCEGADEKEVVEIKQEVEEPRRRRGAALKITSFKELSLNSKMRRLSNTVVINDGKPKAKGRQSSRSSTS
ncbi:uncharacterized protein LOC122259092 isoform X2 [Penaeus japonicus]|uniref:uncharacterized protein LOC122259092 isoform X2 n=1 Tax=Penaeus japonicus TaxID=27405 RepID=UPI001C710D36|nr:uncharacterized protein LOC122259092 isoform X2 [Penaeus japonicus]